MKKSLFYLCLFLFINTVSFSQNSDCYQGDNSNGIGPGRNITAGLGYVSADDFVVSANTTLTLNAIELNVYSPDPVISLDINFYDDQAGEPGNILLQLEDVVPTYQQIIGSYYSMYLYRVILNMDNPISFEGGSDDTTIWFQPELTQENNSMVFWEVTNSGSLGNPIITRESGGPWNPYNQVDHGVFKISCDSIPEPEEEYCVPLFSDTVEPISRVQFADIDNVSNPDINGSARIEYFLDIIANVETGNTYTITLEGNTGGEYENHFKVFIDWNQNMILDDDGEIYEIGTIFNSNGMDGEQATNEIEIPADALTGNTRMRVLKNFNPILQGPCGGYTYGQAEDYTINVSATAGLDDRNESKFAFYPNPVNNILNFSSSSPVYEVKMFNSIGQELNTYKNLNGQSLDLSNYTSGVYFAKISLIEGGEVKNIRIIKK